MFVGENGACLYEAKYCLARVKFSHSPGIINMFITTNDLVIIKQYAAKLLQLCPTLCDPIDGSPPGSPVPGILQARTMEGCTYETWSS